MARHPDAFDADEEAEQRDDEGVTCRRCRARDLYWQDTYDAAGQRRPKLFEDGKPHVCRPSADDFDEIPTRS